MGSILFRPSKLQKSEQSSRSLPFHFLGSFLRLLFRLLDRLLRHFRSPLQRIYLTRPHPAALRP
jgi:hypothetical protein